MQPCHVGSCRSTIYVIWVNNSAPSISIFPLVLIPRSPNWWCAFVLYWYDTDVHPCLSLLSVLAGFGGAAIIIWTRSPFFLHNRTRNVKEKSKRKVKTFRPLHSPVHTAIKPNQILSDQVGRKLPSFEHKRRGEQNTGHSIFFFTQFFFFKVSKNNLILVLAQAAQKESFISERNAQVCFGHCSALQLWTGPTTTHTCLKSRGDLHLLVLPVRNIIMFKLEIRS